MYGLNDSSFNLFRERGKAKEMTPSAPSKPLSAFGLNHGDMIYMSPSNAPSSAPSENGSSSGSSSLPLAPATVLKSSVQGSKIPKRSTIEEEEVDKVLQKMDGKIYRKRDPKA